MEFVFGADFPDAKAVQKEIVEKQRSKTAQQNIAAARQAGDEQQEFVNDKVEDRLPAHLLLGFLGEENKKQRDKHLDDVLTPAEQKHVRVFCLSYLIGNEDEKDGKKRLGFRTAEIENQTMNDKERENEEQDICDRKRPENASRYHPKSREIYTQNLASGDA